MNKIFNRLIYVCVVFLMLIPLVSCSDGGSSGTTGGTTGTLNDGGSSGTTGGTTGTLVLGLTDAPAPEYENVFVTIKEVRVKHEEKTDWDILTYPDLDLPQTFDLLELRDGVIADLGLAELEAGHYNQMRLILDTIPTGTHPHANYLYIQGDEVPIPLRVLPSELKNGIKIVGGFTIVASGATEVTLDFDAQKSVVRSNGKKDWHLKPTIKVLETPNNLVFGTVDPAGAYVSGQIFDSNGDFVEPIYDSNGDPIESIMVVNGTFSDDNGDYIIYLPPNTYNIVAFMESYVPECQVVVAEPGYFDWPADDFTLAAADPTGTLTGTVEGLTTAESALFSIRQENTDCGGMIEVTSFPVLEWTTSALITLPAETTYQVVVSAQGEETYVKYINLQADENVDVVYPPGTASAAPPPFEGSVDITPDNPTINVGESVDLTAAWSTGKDVTRYEWVVDNNSQGIVAISDDEKLAGEHTMTYSGVVPGDHEVCFNVWHHTQLDRYADDCVTINVIDQVCTWYGETAWADGAPFNADGRGNWATYTPYIDSGITVALYAGQTVEAGTVEFSEPDSNNEVTITIQLNEGWRFKDSIENVKIQDYDSAPSGNPSPGQFDWKGDATGYSFTIIVPQNSFYGVHIDVERCYTE